MQRIVGLVLVPAFEAHEQLAPTASFHVLLTQVARTLGTLPTCFI